MAYVSLVLVVGVRCVIDISRNNQGKSSACCLYLLRELGLWPTSLWLLRREFGMLPTSLAGVRPVAYVSLAASARVRHVAYISRGISACGLSLHGGVG